MRPEIEIQPPSRDERSTSLWKSLAVAAVVAAGVVKPNLQVGSAGYIACDVVIAVGAAFGIASSGLFRR